MDVALAELAGRQHGRVALRQLHELGLTDSAVANRVAAGRLHRTGRAVYAVGHRVETRDTAYMNAVLECGPGAALSHRSAADLHGARPCARARVDVIAPGRRGRYLAGVDAHSSRTLVPAETCVVRGIPCTTVARTLLDLAEVVDRRGVERAVEEAERRRLFDGRAVEEVLAHANGRRGAAIVRSVLAGYEEPPMTQEELERRFVELCDRAGVPRPRTQVPVELPGGAAARVDFLWPDARLVVETDGRETHGTRQAFERDRRRDRALTVLGYRVARFTWLDLLRHEGEVAHTISTLLGAPARMTGWARARSSR